MHATATEALVVALVGIGVGGVGVGLAWWSWIKVHRVREAQRLNLDSGMSHSCYDPLPDGRHCGRCEACRLRSKGFEQSGIHDPTAYA